MQQLVSKGLCSNAKLVSHSTAKSVWTEFRLQEWQGEEGWIHSNIPGTTVLDVPAAPMKPNPAKETTLSKTSPSIRISKNWNSSEFGWKMLDAGIQRVPSKCAINWSPNHPPQLRTGIFARTCKIGIQQKNHQSQLFVWSDRRNSLHFLSRSFKFTQYILHLQISQSSSQPSWPNSLGSLGFAKILP